MDYSQILIIVATLAGAVLAYYIPRKFIIPLILKLTARTKAKWDEVLLNERVLISACRILPALVIWGMAPRLMAWLPASLDMLFKLTLRLVDIYVTVMVLCLVFAFLNAMKLLETNMQNASRQYMESLINVLKIVAVFIGGIVIVSILLDKNPVTLLAGLGAASAVLSLVFKDTIEGLVAGVRLTSNDMLHKGDWITVPNANADGTVEEMTLSTVKIRNFDNTIITVSPISLINGSFQNWRGMSESAGRRVKRRVYMDFHSIHFVDSADGKQNEPVTNLGLYCKDLEDYLAHCPLVNQQMTYMVRQLEATQSGLPIELYFFLKEKEWKTYEHQLAYIMEYAYAMAPKYGLKVYQQYPIQ